MGGHQDGQGMWGEAAHTRGRPYDGQRLALYRKASSTEAQMLLEKFELDLAR